MHIQFKEIKSIIRLLDSLKDRKAVFLFGTGKFADLIYQHIDKNKTVISGYFDNNKDRIGTNKHGLPVEEPRYIEDVNVVIASGWQEEIYRQLISLGYKENDILRIKKRKRVWFHTNKKISYRNFGFIPEGRFALDFKRKLFGVPNLLKRLQAKDIIKTLNLQADETVLDFGCNSGYFTLELAKLSKKAYGIDIKEFIKRIPIPTELEAKLEFISARGENLPFDDDFFDVVMASEVICMIEDPTLFFKEIHRILKPNGRLVVINGVGRPLIKDAFHRNNRKLQRLKKRYPERFPKTYHEYDCRLQLEFKTSVKKFITDNETLQLMEASGYKIRKAIYSPSYLYGKYFEWKQLKRYLKGEKPSLYTAFPIKYFFYSVLNRISKKKYPGGFICEGNVRK